MLKLESLRNEKLTDPEGEWIESRVYPGVSYLVRSNRYPEFETARDTAAKKLAQAYPQGNAPSAVSMKAIGLAMAEHLLLGWKGLDVPYSRDTALAVLSDFSYRKVVNDVEDCASRVGDRNLEFIETTAKNSELPSAIS